MLLVVVERVCVRNPDPAASLIEYDRGATAVVFPGVETTFNQITHQVLILVSILAHY